MSGFCGVFGSSPVDRSERTMFSMLESMKHRGLDGMNAHADPESGGALGHAHLNAFAAPGTSLPAFAVQDGVALAIDGGVTNRPELLADPSAPQAPIHPNQDVNAVLAAYRMYGDDFLSKLDGPFSLALWDKPKRRLVLSRDKLGEKSLYYHVDAKRDTVIFASEIKTILAHPAVHPELDWDGLSLYFSFGYIPGPKTLFQRIHKLLPGELLQFDLDDHPQTRKYWHLPHITDGVTDEAYCVRQLRHLFMRGLERYVNGSEEIGVFLSGGVDSSIIVAGLRELGVPRIATFTIGFDAKSKGANEEDRQDLFYARLVADKFGTEHHEVVIESGHRPGSALLSVIRQFDDLIMTPNSYSKYLLAQAARQAGISSVLTGSAAAGACGVHRKFLDPKKRAKLLKNTKECATDEERYYKLRSRLFDVDTQSALLRQPPRIGKREILEVLHHYIGDIHSDDFFRLFLFSNLMITSTEKSLKVLDKAGLLASVVVRSPYLDRALVEFSTQLPSSFDGGASYVSLKTHMKKAFENELPQPVLDRTVVGYPSYYWNHGELLEHQERVLSRESIEEHGILNYETVARLVEEDTHSDAKSAGKTTWTLTQFCLWYELLFRQNLAIST